MTARTPGGVRASGESYLREVGRARRGALLGRPAPSLRSISERYDVELGRDAIDVAADLLHGAAEGTDDAAAARSLLGWLAELEVDRRLAPFADRIEQWRATAVVRAGDGHTVPFDAVRRTIASQPVRAARSALDRERTALIERELLSTLVDREARWRDVVERVGIDGSLGDVVERLSGSDLASLADRARTALARGEDAWRDSLAGALRTRGAISLAEATAADLLFAIGTNEIDGALPAAHRFEVARAAAMELGFGAVLETRLAVERAPAAEARERAECVAVDVPSQVHLIVGTAGGLRAYDVVLEEAGRALHLAHADPDAPFELRSLSDPGTRGMCGQILASVLRDRQWLARRLSLSRSECATVARAAALVALYDLRRACAATLYRTQWLVSDLPYGAAQELYVAIMTNALGVAPDPVDALFDAPPSLAPGARMRALESAGTLVEELVERFDVDWHRNPRTGPWLAQYVFGASRGRGPEDVVTRASGRNLSLARYIERLETELTT